MLSVVQVTRARSRSQDSDDTESGSSLLAAGHADIQAASQSGKAQQASWTGLAADIPAWKSRSSMLVAASILVCFIVVFTCNHLGLDLGLFFFPPDSPPVQFPVCPIPYEENPSAPEWTPSERTSVCATAWSKWSAIARGAAQRSPEPTMVFDASSSLMESGMSDRLLSAVTGFYLAMLTGRSFQIRWNGAFGLEQAMGQPHINWTYTAGLTEDANATGSLHDLDFYYVRKLKEKEIRWLFGRTNLTALAPAARVIRLTLNEGKLTLLFSNPYARHLLMTEWGLRLETALGCAYQYLFTPKPEVLASVGREHAALSRIREGTACHKPAVIIAVQLRLGDEYLMGETCDLGLHSHVAEPYFDCADQLEQAINAVGDFAVYWYVLSDCGSLRSAAQSYYGAKIITSTNVTLDRQTYQAFLAAAGESWILSMADYYVISEGSGFGWLAAENSLRDQHIYHIYPNKKRACGLHDFEMWTKRVRDWPYGGKQLNRKVRE